MTTARPFLRLFLALIENEILKLVRRRRPQLVLAILTIFLAISTYGQWRNQQENLRQAGGPIDWRARVEQRIENNERRANRRRIFVGAARMMRFEAARLRYHLQRDLDPDRRTGPLFSRAFAAVAGMLLFPLLVTVLVTDLVSSESRAGTIKMLLTRPVARWKVLLSKLAVMALFTSLLVAAAALLSWLIAGLAFGWRGFGAPVLTGFRAGADGVDLTSVRMAPLWLDTAAAYGLAWFAALVTGAIAVTCSVLFRSSAAAMGTLLSMIVAGTLLGQLADDWQLTKWLFMTNLPLSQFYSGVPPPVAGMTLGHSIAVLAAWGAAAVAVGLYVFQRRDVTV